MNNQAENRRLAVRCKDFSLTPGFTPVKGSPKESETVSNGFSTLGRSAFTLIELLVVIAIIAILAGLVFPITGAVSRFKIQSKSRAQMGQIETWIEDYKTKLGHYPPDNPDNYLVNQLYYELAGTVLSNAASGPIFVTLNGAATMPVSELTSGGAFGTTKFGGFVNAKTGSAGGDEASSGYPFIKQIKQEQLGSVSNTTPQPTIILVGFPWSLGPAPFNNYPISTTVAVPGTNPWRYNSSSPKHNSSTYDLWIDVMIGKKCYRICNWDTKPVSIQDPGY